MKIVAISGSPRRNGNTDRLLAQILEGAQSNGHETVSFSVPDLSYGGCRACYGCKQDNKCVVEDDLQAVYKALYDADRVIIGSPVYMGQMTGQLKLVVDRFFAFMNPDFTSRLTRKPRVTLVFTNGMADPVMFRPYEEETMRMLGFVGFEMGDIFTDNQNGAPDAVTRKPDVMQRAFDLGKNL